MSAINRSGVKLVEVMVVVAILLVGTALLIVYVLHGRESARRAMCLERQKQLAEALQGYEALNGEFPGYVNHLEIGKEEEPVEVSWVVMILRYCGEEDLWKKWEGGQQEIVYLPKLVCPADFPAPEIRASGPLSFVVNCGVVDKSGEVEDGVFGKFDGVSLDFISRRNGVANVWLLSENIQAGYWTDTTIADVGMVAFEKPGPCSGINQCIDAGDRPQEIKYARPSSFHSGAVNVAFCDGNARFIQQDVE